MANAWVEGKFSVRMGETRATLRISDRTQQIGVDKMADLSRWLQIEVNKARLKEHTNDNY